MTGLTDKLVEELSGKEQGSKDLEAVFQSYRNEDVDVSFISQEQCEVYYNLNFDPSYTDGLEPPICQYITLPKKPAVPKGDNQPSQD